MWFEMVLERQMPFKCYHIGLIGVQHESFKKTLMGLLIVKAYRRLSKSINHKYNLNHRLMDSILRPKRCPNCQNRYAAVTTGELSNEHEIN